MGDQGDDTLHPNRRRQLFLVPLPILYNSSPSSRFGREPLGPSLRLAIASNQASLALAKVASVESQTLGMRPVEIDETGAFIFR